MFRAHLITFYLSFIINEVMCNEKRLLSSIQNDFDIKLQQLQTVVTTLQKSLTDEQLKVQQMNVTMQKSLTEEQLKVQQMNVTIAMLQESSKTDNAKISALEAKVNNSIQHMVGFTACHSPGSTIGKGQTVVYDTIISNIGKAYDVRDGEFNVPFDGFYTFSFTGMASWDTDMYLSLVRNGIALHQIYSNVGRDDSSTISLNLHLNTGDAIWIINSGAGSDRLQPYNYNCFSGMLIREG